MPAATEFPRWDASIGQQRHWNYQRQHPDSAALNIPVAAHLSGPVDPDALQAALRAVVARHESLSATFGLRGERLVAWVRGASAVAPNVLDLSGQAPGERARLLREAGRVHARHAYDLATEVPCRLSIVRCGPEQHVLIVTVHHIAFDAWSVPVFFADLQRAYTAARQGSAGLDPPNHRYVDFARWQRRELAAGAFDRQLDYWLSTLADLPGPLELPTAGAEPDAPWHAGRMCWLPMPGELLDAVRAFARSGETTLFVPLLAAFHWLLARTTGADDIAVGVPYAARTRPQWEGIVGFFVNTLVLRQRVEPQLTFRQLATRCHHGVLAGHDNQDVPLGVVLDRLRPPVTPDRSPLFQAMLILQNTASPRQQPGPLRLRATKLVTGSARYDVLFSFSRYRQGLALELETRRRFVATELAARLGREFFNLLAAGIAEPDQPLRRLRPPELDVAVTWSMPATAEIGPLFDPIVAHW